MKPLTLQARVSLWAAAVTAVGMILCGAAIAFLASRSERAELDLQLQSEAEGFFHEWQLHGGPKFDFEADPEAVREWLSTIEPARLVEVADAKGRILYRSASLKGDSLHTLPLGLHDYEASGIHWRYAGYAWDGITLRLTADLASIHALLRTILTAFLIALPVLLLFVIVSARWAAHVALEPVRQITNAAEEVSAEAPSSEVPVPQSSDEIQRLATVLNRAFSRLRQSYRQARRFSADASHELKTPLTVIRASAESLLESDSLPPAQAQIVAGMLEQTSRLTAITESLLLLSRADAGRLNLDWQRVSVSELVQACIDDAEIVAQEKEVTIKADIATPLEAECDGGRFCQIVVNLLDNAVKYNDQQGRVAVHLSASDGELLLRIGNGGPGIAPEHAASIFERFFRGEPGHAVPGHGLGLSLSRELARAHGGDLTLVSSTVGWTEFLLRLPANGRMPAC